MERYREICGFKPVLLWLRLTPSPSLLFSLCPPAVGQEVTKLEARGSPARPFIFPGQRDGHPFQFSETLLCSHFHSSDITGKRNWTDVLVILRHLLNGIQGSRRGQKSCPLDFSYSLLTGHPASPAQVASHFSGEERDTVHLQTHTANSVVSMASIPPWVFI